MLKSMIVRVEPELLRRAKKTAIDRNTTLQALVTAALERYLPREITPAVSAEPPQVRRVTLRTEKPKPLANWAKGDRS